MSEQFSLPNKTIAVIGGGSSGTAATIQLLKTITKKQEGNSSPQTITIRMFDPSGRIGPGLPYHTPGDPKGEIFLLNQPAYGMSPFASDPAHFTRWLKRRDPRATEFTFASRHMYGEYLSETFVNAYEEAQVNGAVKVEVISSEITNIGNHDNCFSLVDSKYRFYDADSVILANGHVQSKFLSDYTCYSNYFDCPFDIERSREILKDDQKGVLLVGTSQTMLDGLSILNHIGYKGPIYAASRKLVLPWAFNPYAHKQQSGNKYSYAVLTPEYISTRENLSFDDLHKVFELEIARAETQNFPMGYVLGAFDAASLDQFAKDETTRRSIEQLSQHIIALYGNPTPPQRFRLLEEYMEYGNFQLLRTSLSEDKIRRTPDGFSVQVDSSAGIRGNMLNVRAIYNCASQQMKAIDDKGVVLSPLLEKLDRQGAMIRNPSDRHAFSAGEQAWKDLYLVGPATNSRRWGVETFRTATQDVAGKVAASVIDYTPVDISKLILNPMEPHHV
jgi:uncharacterized NAD(P)/FAD-binding protein YdhS